MPSQYDTMSCSIPFPRFILGHLEDKQANLMIKQLKRYEDEEIATLCEACVRALTELAKPSLLGHSFDWRYVIHQQSFSALRWTAESRNCRLCHLLFEVVKRELNERYSTEDFLPALVNECHGEPSFAFHPWTEELDTEISPISTGLETVRYAAFREGNNASFQGVNYHGFYDGIRLSIERLAGSIVTLLGRQVATSPPDKLAKRWIDYCNTLHRKCPRIKKTSLPTRIIDLGTGRNGQGAHIVLREGLKRKARYVALSHCWGSREPRLVLRDSTHEQLLRGIPYGDLEKNFQDAIRVTRALGYQYLWIDTLCIIQHQEDKADWVKECSLMEGYYSNAAITIAAADAQDAYAGFFHTRKSFENSSNPILFRMSISGCAVIAQITNRPAYDPSARVLSTLNSRAWAFQERHLSPRILYFSAQKMFFECASSEQHESLHYPIVQHILPRFESLSKESRASSQQELTQCTEDFYSMVWQYCRCSLTKVDDRLTAFSGIARRYHKRTSDRYLAGIWQSSITRGLNWERDKPKEVVEDYTRGQAAPSWSWAACKAKIEFWHISQSLITLESSYIRPKTSDVFGEVELGVLKITGSLMEARLSHDTEASYCYLHYTVFYHHWETEVALCACDDRDRCATKCMERTDEAREHEERVTCLFLSTAMAHFNRGWCCLILEHYNNEPEVFRRVGLAWKRPEHMDSIDWANLPNRRTIYLV